MSSKLEELRSKLTELLENNGRIEEKPKGKIDLSKLPVLLQIAEQLMNQIKSLKETEKQNLFIVKNSRNEALIVVTNSDKLADDAQPLLAIAVDNGNLRIVPNTELFKKIYIVQEDGATEEFAPSITL